MKASFLPLFAAFALLVGTATRAETPPAPVAPASKPSQARVKNLRVTVLSTMLADKGIGEWGFAALVEADGRRILFDTGYLPNTVLQNAKEQGIDLSDITDVILSHNHDDHTGGLITLRRELSKKNPAALSRAHVAPGIFWSRPKKDGGEGNPMVAFRPEYEAAGGTFIEHTGPVELAPGVWLTGSVPRPNPERNWSSKGQVQSPQGLVEETIPEDQALVIDTDQGLVVITGCGHAGVVNILEFARKQVRSAPIHAVLGGLHLFRADEKTLAWTGRKLREMKLGNLLGAHCTGIEAVFRLRELAGLQRSTCVVGAVGASFELGKGLNPLELAR